MAKVKKECTVCGARVVRLWSHMLVHKPKLIKCDLCSKVFHATYKMKRHFETVHERLKRFDCVFCGKMFSGKTKLWDHLLRHIEEKPYDCLICNKSFCSNYELNLHIRLHTTEKPFKCQICEKSFSVLPNMKKHAATHVIDSLRIRYECKDCQKTYKSHQGLKKHHEIHHLKISPRHWCVFCGKGFHRGESLLCHILGHVNEQPFNCSHCEKSFYLPSHRKRHFRNVHTIGVKTK